MSNKLPVFSSKKFIKAAKHFGFKIKKGGKGSHTRLIHPKHKLILTIPKAKTISIGVRHKLLNDLKKTDISYEKFINFLSIGLLAFIKNILAYFK